METYCGYVFNSIISQGSYGVVFKAYEKNTNASYAIKIVSYKKSFEKNGISNLIEFDVLYRLKHPYLINGINFFTEESCKDIENDILFVLPLGDLDLNKLSKTKRLSTKEKLEILFKVAKAIEFLHQNKILHLDIKPNNIVINSEIIFSDNLIIKYHPYVIDFGLSTYIPNPFEGKYEKTIKGTIPFEAPEIFNLKYNPNVTLVKYTPSADVWSFGITSLYLLSNNTLFSNISLKDEVLLYRTIRNLFSNKNRYRYIKDLLSDKIDKKYLQSCVSLLYKILALNPNERPSFTDICNDPLFKEFSKLEIKGITYRNVKYISKDISEVYKAVTDFIVKFTRDFLNDLSVEVLFLAIDLYNRSLSDEKIYLNHLLNGITCLWIAIKYIKGYNFINIKTFIENFNKVSKEQHVNKENIFYNEISIITKVEGLINVSKLYKLCYNNKELKIAYQEVILKGDPIQYNEMDKQKWELILKEYDIKERVTDEKNLTIKDL